MKRTLVYLSLAAVLCVTAFARTSSFANTSCKDCCKDKCGQACREEGCTGSCCNSK